MRGRPEPVRLVLFIMAACWLVVGRHAAAKAIVVDPATGLANRVCIGVGNDLEDGPDLDLGRNDSVDVTITAARGEARDVTLIYVCDGPSRPRSTRSFTIPEGTLVADGRPHVYRIDLGLEAWWRGRLSRLDVDPPAMVSGVTIGDGEERDYESGPVDPAWASMSVLESKHFRIFYGSGESERFTAEQARGTLRNFEECWQVFVKVLGLEPPRPVEGGGDRRLKTTITTHEPGFMTGGGVVNIDPTGLRVDPPSWVIPHELMHAFQEVQGGGMAGLWWESHANYGCERALRHFHEHHLPDEAAEATPDETADERPHENAVAGSTRQAVSFQRLTCFEPVFMTMAHWYPAHGRDYYLCWPLWAYLDENPHALVGLGPATSTALWRRIETGESLPECLARLDPKVDLKAVFGGHARAAVTWDYSNGAAMRRVSDAFLAGSPDAVRLTYPALVARPDDPGWWAVPADMAPLPGGYTMHELEPAERFGGTAREPQCGRVVSVDLRGLAVGEGADWRWTLVAVDDAGREARASGPHPPGKAAIELPASTSRLVLVVAATPDQWPAWDHDDLRQPWRTDATRMRHRYEVRIDGASPRSPAVVRPQAAIAGQRHTLGGGFVASTAHVASTAFVGPEACVLGEARVEDHARVEGRAVVTGRAMIRGRTRVGDFAVVRDQAVVEEDARVLGHALVLDDTRVAGRARVLGRATLRSRAIVCGDATVGGCCDVWRDDDAECSASGDAVLTADYGGGRPVTNGVQTGFVPYVACPEEWIRSRTAPPHRIVSHDFDGPHHAVIADGPGLDDSLVIGDPLWLERDGPRRGVLKLDGDDGILLVPTVTDLVAATVGIWMRPDNDGGGPLLSLRGWEGAVLEWSAGTDTLPPSLIVTGQDGKHEIRWPRPLPADRWTHLAFTLDGREAAAFVDGQAVARAACSARLEDFRVGPDPRGHDRAAWHVVGLAIDPGRPGFRGSIDSVRIWSRVPPDAGWWPAVVAEEDEVVVPRRAEHEPNAIVPAAGYGDYLFRVVGPDCPVLGDAVIRGPAGGSEIVIRTTSRVAGAIDSLEWNGRRFIDSADHGRQLQSASNFEVEGDFFDETFNPTEAGSMHDGVGPTSTSRVLLLSAAGREFGTVTRMAFWLRPGETSGGHPARNTVALSDHLLTKQVRIGRPDLPPPARDHAIRYDVAFMLPADEPHVRGTFEALTGYMPAEFRVFHALASDGVLEPLSDGPGEQQSPVVVSTADGQFAMGCWSSGHAVTTGAPASYGRFWFEREQVSKWNCVFREAAPDGGMLRSGTYRYSLWVAVGTREQVRETLATLQDRESRRRGQETD